VCGARQKKTQHAFEAPPPLLHLEMHCGISIPWYKLQPRRQQQTGSGSSATSANPDESTHLLLLKPC
jgi:hypothetical protein